MQGGSDGWLTLKVCIPPMRSLFWRQATCALKCWGKSSNNPTSSAACVSWTHTCITPTNMWLVHFSFFLFSSFSPPPFSLIVFFSLFFFFFFFFSLILYLLSFPFRVSFPPYFFFFYLCLSIVIWKVHSKAGPLQSRQLQLTGSQTDGLSHAIAWPLIHNRRATVKWGAEHTSA